MVCVDFGSVAASIVVVVVVWNRLLSGHCPFFCTICLGMLLLLRSREIFCQQMCVNALVVVMQGRKELVVSQYQTSVLLLFNDKGMHSRTPAPCNYFPLPYMRLLLSVVLVIEGLHLLRLYCCVNYIHFADVWTYPEIQAAVGLGTPLFNTDVTRSC